MRATVERSILLKSLNHVQSVVERRNTIPILSNVLIDARENGLTLTTTDLDIQVVETLKADVSQPGGSTVPAHMIYDIVRKLPDGAQLELLQQADDGRLSITSGRSRFFLQSLPPDDFPDLSAGKLTHEFTLSAGDMKALIEKVRFAISTEETRHYLNGIYLHHVTVDGEDLLRAVATDGHRLAQAQIACPEGASGMPGLIVPRKTVAEIARVNEDNDGDIAISLSQSKIRFSAGDLVLTSKVIDGAFPDYERVIPTDNDKILEVDTKLFDQAVDRVSTVASDKGRAVKLSLQSDRVLLSVNNPDSGSAEEELAATYQSDPFDVGFNSRYLTDICKQFSDKTMQIHLANAGAPAIIRSCDDAVSLYVLMPMRV